MLPDIFLKNDYVIKDNLIEKKVMNPNSKLFMICMLDNVIIHIIKK